MNNLKPISDWLKKVNLTEATYSEEAMFRCMVGEVLEAMGVLRPEGITYILWDVVKNHAQMPIQPYRIAEELADLIVFVCDFITRLGYDPTLVLDEVTLKINSRSGRYDPALGKWVKNPSQTNYIPQEANMRKA